MKDIIEILKEQGIELQDDKAKAVTKAVAEEYKTIKEYRNTVAKLEGERDSYKQQLRTAKEALQEFDGVDVNDMKEKMADYEKKMKEQEEDYKKQLYDRDFSDALTSAMESYQFTSEYTLYNCLISAGGLAGNRSNPKYAEPGLYVLNATKMIAVLVEHGFMDSNVDTPVILAEEYAEKMANGWIAFFEQYLGIVKKDNPVQTGPAANVQLSNKLYYVQIGAFTDKANAEALAHELVEKGYQAIVN